MHGKFVPTLEADDLMGIASSSGTAVAVTLDKDLLSCPGLALPSRVLVQGQGQGQGHQGGRADLSARMEGRPHVLSAVADGRYDR